MNGSVLKLDKFRLVRNYNYLISKAFDHWKNFLRTAFNSPSQVAFIQDEIFRKGNALVQTSIKYKKSVLSVLLLYHSSELAAHYSLP